jgi:hypothetical protein
MRTAVNNLLEGHTIRPLKCDPRFHNDIHGLLGKLDLNP